jgi:hypothetical protein
VGLSFSGLDIKAKLPDLVKPAGEELIDVPFGAEPRDRLVVRAEKEVRANAMRPKRPAAGQVVTENVQGMDHGKKLQDMGQITLLCRRELTALTGDRVIWTPSSSG